MPYKDKEKSKEAATERQRKHRQGVTLEGVTGEGVTRVEFIKDYINDPFIIEGIESKIKKDWPERYERAYIYKLKRSGVVLDTVIGKDLAELQAMTSHLEATR